jgi:choline monooxygenase
MTELAHERALEPGRTLPADYYTDSEIFQREKAEIFGEYWQYAGPIERLAHPGDFITYRAGDVPVVVVRGSEGQLRAFANVCRHRGTEVVQEASGNRRTLQCPYHGWTYGLDGRLRAAPRMKEEPDFRVEDHALPELGVEAWGPFVFVNPNPAAISLSQQLGDLSDILDKCGVNLDSVHYHSRLEYDMRCNWKIVVENFSECYHCPIAHPSLADLLDMNAYRVVEHGYVQTHVAPLRAKPKDDTEDWHGGWDVRKGYVHEGSFNFVWPNFMLNVYPGPGNVSTNLIHPLGTDRTLAVYEFFFSDDVSDHDRSEIKDYVDLIQREDIPLCESVQRGMMSGFFDQGTLMSSRENGIQHFQALVHACVGSERRTPAHG